MRKLIILLLCCGMRWQHRTTAYRESADNGIGNGNNRNTDRNNTACDGGRADRGRKRVCPDQKQGTGNRAENQKLDTDDNTTESGIKCVG